MSRRMALSQLADGLFGIPPDFNPLITGMTADSRVLREGDAFIAVSGLTAHGLNYLKPELAGKVAAKGGVIGVVISGGNADPAVFARALAA